MQTSLENKVGIPDIQINHFQKIIKDVELSAYDDGFGPSYYPGSYYDSFSVSSRVIAAKSVGRLRLHDTDPIWSHPKLKMNYLTHPHDVKTIVEGALMISKLFETQVFKKIGVKKFTRPAKGCEQFKFESPKYFECAAKKYARAVYHVTGTCKMGPKNDSTAVVDPKLRVYGIQGLRVIDASIMPVVPRGNTYSSTIMVAEKGSDLVKQKWL